MTRTSKATAIDALNTIGAGVTGIIKSYDVNELPASLATANLPCLIHFDNGTEVIDLTAGRGYVEEIHHVMVKVVIEPAAQRRLEDNMGTGISLYDNYFATLMTETNSSTSNWAYCAIADASPLGEWTWAEVVYHALDISVDIHIYS